MGVLEAPPEFPTKRLQLLEAFKRLVPTRNLLGHHFLPRAAGKVLASGVA